VLGFEIKSNREIIAKDFRSLREVGAALGSEWRGGIVMTRGTQIERLDETGNV
jgi:hypothetical protein